MEDLYNVQNVHLFPGPPETEKQKQRRAFTFWSQQAAKVELHP